MSVLRTNGPLVNHLMKFDAFYHNLAICLYDLLHYENLPMQYTEIFKNEKSLIFFLFLLKT